MAELGINEAYWMACVPKAARMRWPGRGGEFDVEIIATSTNRAASFPILVRVLDGKEARRISIRLEDLIT